MDLIVRILFTHWIADFLCQTRKMADNKGKSIYWLSVHVLTYGVVMFAFLGTLSLYENITLSQIIQFILWNMAFHWCTDLVTSKLTSYFYRQGDTHKFFGVIGLDQFIHTITLAYTSAHFFNIEIPNIL